jgi:hypothetical protein
LEQNKVASSFLRQIEAEIDAAFADNALAELPFAQSAWTLLSVVEDRHFMKKVVAPLTANQAKAYGDVLLNALTHPLRVCYQHAVREPSSFTRELIDEHYALAHTWLTVANDYVLFCSLFPLYHAKEIELRVQGHVLIPTDWSRTDLSYEVYNRFVAKRAPEQEPLLDPDLVCHELEACMKLSGGFYFVNFTPRLMEVLTSAFSDALTSRHTLPEDWQFARFSLVEYRAVFTCLQAMAYAWFVARELAGPDGAPAMWYASALWTPRKRVLVATLARHTGMKRSVVSEVLRYLTFGEMNIRTPDIAIQPIVDLTKTQYAISPFVMTHVDAERNLCVLLNRRFRLSCGLKMETLDRDRGRRGERGWPPGSAFGCESHKRVS